MTKYLVITTQAEQVPVSAACGKCDSSWDLKSGTPMLEAQAHAEETGHEIAIYYTLRSICKRVEEA